MRADDGLPRGLADLFPVRQQEAEQMLQNTADALAPPPEEPRSWDRISAMSRYSLI